MNAAVAQPIALITALGGALVLTAANIDWPPTNTEKWIEVALCIISTAILISAVYHFMKAYHGHSYEYVPTAAALVFQPHSGTEADIHHFVVRTL